jgi:hypothetical protein
VNCLISGKRLREKRFKIETGMLVPNDGFLRPANSGGRAVATHPLILRIVREPILNSLSDNNTQQVLQWMAEQTSNTPEAAISIGSLILESANKQGVTINSNGEINGAEPWKKITSQVFEAIVFGSDTGDEVLKTWRDKHNRLNELFTISPRWQGVVLGDVKGNEALLRSGLFRFTNEWKGLNAKASDRFKAFSNITKANLSTAVQNAKILRVKLDSLMGNPLCAPWLPKVAQIDPPRSPETGILLRWYTSQLKPSELEIALDRQWNVITDNLSERVNTDDKKLLSVDYFAPWETMRGAWIGKPLTGENQRYASSPWEQITQENLINNRWKLIEGWLNNPIVFPKNNSAFIGALTAFSWFGLPDNFANRYQDIQKALATSESQDPDLNNANDKLFLKALRLNFVITSLMQSEKLTSAFNNNSLLGANEIKGLPRQIDDLYRDGRPFSIRTATDLAVLLGRRSLTLRPLSSSVATKISTKPQSNETLLFNKFNELQDISRQNLEKLDLLLKQSVESVQNGQFQSGQVLTLAQLELQLIKNLKITTLTPNQRQRSDRINGWNNNLLPVYAIGTSNWGIDAWLDIWQSDVEELDQTRLLTITPISYQKSQERQRQYISVLTALLTGESVSQISHSEAWRDPEVWRIHLAKKDKTDAVGKLGANIPMETSQSQLGEIINNVTISSTPFVSSKTPAGMLVPVLQRASTLQGLTKEVTKLSDLDGLNDNYLPSKSWVEASDDLQRETQKLKELEARISNKYDQVRTWEAVDALKPLLAAPLVVNLASFRNELASAIADVRRAESLVDARKEESLAADMELLAQELLQKVFALEIERTKLLKVIKENEKQRIKIEQDIENKKLEIQNKIVEVGEGHQEVAKLREDKSKLEKQKKDIEVGIAARAVETLQNEVKIIEDLIITKQPHPEFPADASRKLSGQLGILAYNAENKVKSQLGELNSRREGLKSQLGDLREASLIRGITTFIGAVVGAIIGGPAGIQMGAMIGNAVGGIYAGIKQGKPFQEIFKGALQDGFKIAAAAGVDAKAEFNKLGSEGSEIGQMLNNARNVIGPILKELPTYFDKKVFEDALNVSGISDPLRDVLIRIKNESIVNLAGNIPSNFNSPFLNGARDVLLRGTPEEIQKRLEDEALKALRNIPIDEELKKAAKELKISIDKLSDQELRNEMARKVAVLEVVKITSLMNDKRNQILGRLLTSLTTLQTVLKKGKFNNLETALNNDELRRTLNDLTPDEINDHINLLKSLLADIQVRSRQEMSWSELEPKLRDTVTQFFPSDMRRQELILGKLKMQLDSEGMRAEIEKLLNPWNIALQKRMEKVESIMRMPPPSDDQEQRIEWQLNQLDNASQTLNSEVLSWLKDENNNNQENLALKTEIVTKKAKLQDATAELNKADIDLQKALLDISEAGFLKKEAALNLEIAKLNSAVSTLAIQQAELSLKNADLETQRTAIQEEQDVLNALIQDDRATALKNRRNASLKELEAAEAELSSAQARLQASRNRSVVYGQIEGWYANAQFPEINQDIIEINNLSLEHQKHLEDASTVVREMLRIIRFANGNSTGLKLPAVSEKWGDRFEALSGELSNRYVETRLPNVTSFGYDLTEEQINKLFSESGLEFTIAHLEPARIKENYRASAERGVYYIGPGRNEYVFRVYLMAEDENGSFINQSGRGWVRDDASHGTSAPILQRISFGNYTEKNLIWKDPVMQPLVPWEAKIEAEKDKKISQDKIIDIVKRDFDVADISTAVSSSEFKKRRSMPLTGTYHFRVEGEKPKRARIVLVYSFQN